MSHRSDAWVFKSRDRGCRDRRLRVLLATPIIGADMQLPAKLLVSLVAVAFAGPVFSQGLTTFENGKVADADAINSNFSQLDNRLQTLESEGASYSGNNIIGYNRVLVDCAANNSALAEAIRSLNPKIDQVRFEISGECRELQDNFAPGWQGKNIVISGRLEGAAECPPELPVIGSGNASVRLGIAGGSLWLDCVEFDADTAYVSAYANAYIRIDAVSVKAADQRLEAVLWNNSTLRVFGDYGATHFAAIKATNSSAVNLRGAITVDQLRLNVSSVLWCEFCSGRIESVTMREASNATLWPSGSNLAIGTLDATQRSITFINSVYGTVTIENQSESSVIDIRSEPLIYGPW